MKDSQCEKVLVDSVEMDVSTAFPKSYYSILEMHVFSLIQVCHT